MEQTYEKPPELKVEDFTGNGVAHKETDQDKFLKSILDQAKDYPLPESVITLFNNGETIPLLTKKSFSLWQGKQKSKKTTLLALAIAAYINPRASGDAIHFECGIPGKILFFDTEQGESYAARTMKLILKLADLSISPCLIYCDLRQFTPAERTGIIQAGIECTPDVKLIVIDGIVDLLTDFMDAKEGHLSITNIIRLCSVHDIHIAGILHQNKADKNARAHVGSISSQKCEIEISTEVDPNDKTQSLVTCVNSRGMPFQPFAVKWEKGSLPCIVQEWTAESAADAKADRQAEKIKEYGKAVFKPLAALPYTEAIEGLMNITLKTERTCERYLKMLSAWKLITKGPDGLYRLMV